MRIGYVVDVHDRFDAVVEAVAAMGPVDVLVVGGDITTGGTVEQAEEAIARWRPLAPCVVALAGNMDSPAIDGRLAELGVALDGTGIVVGGVGICGVSAAPISPLCTPYELPEEELARRIERAFAAVAGARWTIFCPHAPPLGTACDRLRSGEHVGSAAVRAAVEQRKPDVVLCGHIHEARGEDTLGRTRVVNPGPVRQGHYALVEVGEAIAVSLDPSAAAA